MVDTNREEFEVRIDDSQARRAADDVEKRLGKMFDKSALKAAAFNQALGLGMRAMTAMVESLKDGVRSAIEYEKTTLQLTNVLRGVGDSSGYWLGVLQRQSNELEKLTGISDETIRQYQVMALNMGVASDRIDNLIRASISLGNAMDMDVRTAMTQIVKTQTGLVEETLKATGAVGGLTKQQLIAGQAIDVINEKFAQQLTVMTQGTSGAGVSLTTAWQNLWEEVGKFATLDTSVSVINSIADALQRMADGVANIRNLDLASLGKAYLGSLAGLTMGLPGFFAGGAFAAGGEAAGGGMLPLEPLVKPVAVGRKRGASSDRRRKGGRRERSTEVDFGADESFDEFVIAPDGQVYSIDVWDQMQEMSAKIGDSLDEMAQVRADRRIQLSNDVADAEIAAMQRSAEGQMETYTMIANIGRQAFSSLLDVLETLVAGGDVAWGQLAAGFIKSVGQQILGQGIGDILKGTSMLITSVGLNPQAHALMAHGGIEVAIGGAMAASGAVAAGMATAAGAPGGGGGGGGGGGSSAAGSFAAGSSGRSWGDAHSRGGGGDVIVNLHGPVYDGPSAGVAIVNAIRLAKQQGLA